MSGCVEWVSLKIRDGLFIIFFEGNYDGFEVYLNLKDIDPRLDLFFVMEDVVAKLNGT